MTTNLIAGWIAVLAGVVSGAIIGMWFHDEQFMGGYSSFRRRLTRLGHISFFGLGFLNILFALSADLLPLPASHLSVASPALVAGLISMPTICFLTAWREPFRRLFFIPVGAVLVGVVAMLMGWMAA